MQNCKRNLLLVSKTLNSLGGAYYEKSVAAAMIKAGFESEFENEADRTNSYCEFMVTYPAKLNFLWKRKLEVPKSAC